MEEEIKEVSDVTLFVSFDGNREPHFGFNGAWSIRDLGRVRNTIFRAYKHYIKEMRAQLKEEAKNERANG